MSTEEDMEIYLNVAEWGPGIYGAEAAAQHHFGVPASKLTRGQARADPDHQGGGIGCKGMRKADLLGVRGGLGYRDGGRHG